MFAKLTKIKNIKNIFNPQASVQNGLSIDADGVNKITETPAVISSTIKYFNSSGEILEKQINNIHLIPNDVEQIYVQVHMTKNSTARVTILQYNKTVYTDTTKRMAVPVLLKNLDLTWPHVLRVDIRCGSENQHHEYVIQKN